MHPIAHYTRVLLHTIRMHIGYKSLLHSFCISKALLQNCCWLHILCADNRQPNCSQTKLATQHHAVLHSARMCLLQALPLPNNQKLVTKRKK